ncbi:MAG: sugar phosphate isomerase/epimerase [Thermoflexibacter sp.]
MNRRDFLLALPAIHFAWKMKPKPLKLSFSTLGCPEWTWEDILQNAKKLGYQGIELRGLGKEIDLTKCSEFSPSNIATTFRKVKDNNLKIVNLGSSANLHFHEENKRQEQIDHAKKYIDLAEKLACPYIRVFPNNLPKEYSKEATLEKIASALLELSLYAKGSKVKILLETHGEVVQTDDLLVIMKSVNRKNIGLIWDFFNMFIITRQSPAAMYQALKDYIAHVHLKDGIVKADGSFQYTFLGQGNLPIAEIIRILKENHYKGYYSFEWEKRWHPELPAPELAFPEFVKYMQQ